MKSCTICLACASDPNLLNEQNATSYNNWYIYLSTWKSGNHSNPNVNFENQTVCFKFNARTATSIACYLLTLLCNKLYYEKLAISSLDLLSNNKPLLQACDFLYMATFCSSIAINQTWMTFQLEFYKFFLFLYSYLCTVLSFWC